jgi:hypothetical protein
MTTQVGVGFSQLDNPVEAGRQAAQQALQPLANRKPNLVLLLITSGMEQEQVLAVLAEVRAVTGAAPLIGGCNSGIIVSRGAFTSGVAVLALRSDEIQVVTDIVTGVDQNPARNGRSLVRRLRAQRKETHRTSNELLLTLLDIQQDGLSTMVETMGNELGPLCRLVGGGIMDSTGRITRSTFLNGEAYRKAVATALLLTPGPIGVRGGHGYKPLGRPLVVTRSEGDVVYELDGRSAFQAYVEQFPEHPELVLENFGSFAMNYPLGIPQMGREYIVRDPLQARPDGSLEFGGPIPENAVVRIMEGDRKTLIQSAKESAMEAMYLLKGRHPLLTLVFSCITRLNYLGEAAQEEVAVIREVVGAETPLIGIFSFGEVGAQSDGPPTFHNKIRRWWWASSVNLNPRPITLSSVSTGWLWSACLRLDIFPQRHNLLNI